MKEHISLLETQPKEKIEHADPCILPLVVLFSIAAQENRGVGSRSQHFKQNLPARPMQMYRPKIGQMGQRTQRIASGVTRPNINMRRTWMY